MLGCGGVVVTYFRALDFEEGAIVYWKSISYPASDGEVGFDDPG